MNCDKNCGIRLFNTYTNNYSFYTIIMEIFCKYPKWLSNVTSCQLSILTSTITEIFIFWCVQCSERTWVLSPKKKKKKKEEEKKELEWRETCNQVKWSLRACCQSSYMTIWKASNLTGGEFRWKCFRIWFTKKRNFRR